MNFWSCTEKGPKRPQNQDVCFTAADPEGKWALILVCDGMGGAKSGNVASSLASSVFSEIVSDGMDAETPSRRIGELMKTGAASANDAVYDMSLTSGEFSGMGTTLVAAVVTERACVVLNVGDSRAYHVSDSGIVQISRDHSLVEELIGRGELTREESGRYPGRNLITRAVGTSESVKSDLFYPDLKIGEYILLCSDGLTNVVSEQEILFEILHGGSSEDCCQRLIGIAVSRGAPDNVTAVLLKK